MCIRDRYKCPHPFRKNLLLPLIWIPDFLRHPLWHNNLPHDLFLKTPHRNLPQIPYLNPVSYTHLSRIAGGSDNSCFYHNKFSSFVHTASSFYVCVCRFCQDDKIIHLLCIICNNYFSQYILFFQSLFI